MREQIAKMQQQISELQQMMKGNKGVDSRMSSSQTIHRIMLENPPWTNSASLKHASIGKDSATNNSIVSTTFAVLPQKPLHLDITSSGGIWLIAAHFPFMYTSGGALFCSFSIDGVEVTGGSSGLLESGQSSATLTGGSIFWLATLPIGSHAIDVVARVAGGTSTIGADTNTQCNLWTMELKPN